MANRPDGGGVDGQEVMKTVEAAAFLRVPPKLLAKWAKAGKVPCQKPGKSYLFSKTALLAWLAEPGNQVQDAAVPTKATELVG